MAKLSQSLSNPPDTPLEESRSAYPQLPPRAWENLTDPRVLIVFIIAAGILGLGLVGSGVHVNVFR